MKSSKDKRLNNFFNSKKHSAFIEESWVCKYSDKYRIRLRELSKSINYFDLESKNLSVEDIVSALAQFRVILDDQSGYRRATDFIEKKVTGVMVFHQSHLLNTNVIHLVSRLIRFTDRHNLDWKFVFLGNVKQMGSNIADQLFIEVFFPTKIKNKVTGKYTHNKKRIILISTLICLVSIGLTVYLKQTKDNNTQDRINRLDALSASVISERSEVESETERLEPNVELLDLIRQSKLRNLEFEELFAEIDSETEIATTGNDDSASSTEEATVLPINQTSEINNNITQLPPAAEMAIRNNDLGAVQNLLSTNDLRLSQNESGETPLILAANTDNKLILDWLLSKDVPVNSTDSYGRSAIFFAAIHGDDTLILSLLEAGANVDIRSNLSKTPLMAAVNNEHLSTVKILLAKGAKVNVTDHSGWSAIFYAVWSSNREMVKMLIDNGANMNIKDNSGVTIKEITEAKGEPDLISSE